MFSKKEKIHKPEEEERDVLKDVGVMFLCAIAGYGLSQYQQNKRNKSQICYQQVTDTKTLPDMLADKAEEVIRAGGLAGVRRVGALLELVVQNATGDTQVFRQAADTVKDVQASYEESKSKPAGAAGTASASKTDYATNVEYYDEATDTWRNL